MVFWRLLAREAEWLPPWRELLMALRRLEARGEIRGGRFVAGFSGEQFALPEAVGVLRGTRNEDKAGKLSAVSGADPLNLAGILLPGPKVPALYSNRVVFRDGIAMAALVSGEVQYFEKLDPEQAWELKNLLAAHAGAGRACRACSPERNQDFPYSCAGALLVAWSPSAGRISACRERRHHAPSCSALSTRRCWPALVLAVTSMPLRAAEPASGPGPAAWTDDLSPIGAQDWSYDRAAHLLERAGFGGTPEEIQALAAMTPQQAVQRLVRFQSVDDSALKPFEASDIFDPGIDPFPVSRPATTDEAKKQGEALGVKVKPGGNRRMQPVVNKFFYWLRASRLETDRVAYWWADRMLNTPRPLQEKMALFWHGHFATNEDKVRDYRKMLRQLELFQQQGTGNFRTLLIGVAQDPAMLAFLDAGVNVKGAPNENFAREIMELFSMGVGNYSEKDIREAARAFTGWNFRNLTFQVDPDKHDDGAKTVPGARAATSMASR